MEEFKKFIFKCLAISMIFIFGLSIGYFLCEQHYEPLLRDCEQNQKQWEEAYRNLKTVERRFDLLTAKIELEEAKRRASVIWNEQVIYPDEGD